MSPERRSSVGPRSGLVVSVNARGHVSLARGLAPWLVATAPPRAEGALDIALISDVAMRRLNRAFRGVDATTDVLSFPADSAAAPIKSGRGVLPRYLGDIAIATGVAYRQARTCGHPVGVELKILALHGLLHLLGYDHETDGGRMRRLEERLRRQAGLPWGLIARTPRVHGRA